MNEFGNGPSSSNLMVSPMENPQPQEVPVNSDTPMSVTSITDLQSYSKGTLVRFPDFAEGQPFVARVRRPSMLMLAKTGKIPNSLLASAGELFAKGRGGMATGNKETDADMLTNMYDIANAICEAALINPSMDELKQAGVFLSDDQIMAIFNYTQVGLQALNSFREERGNSQPTGDVQPL